jgi:hypothetical protein
LAYNCSGRWKREDIPIDLVDEASEGEVITVKVSVGGAVP